MMLVLCSMYASCITHVRMYCIHVCIHGWINGLMEGWVVCMDHSCACPSLSCTSSVASPCCLIAPHHRSISPRYWCDGLLLDMLTSGYLDENIPHWCFDVRATCLSCRVGVSYLRKNLGFSWSTKDFSSLPLSVAPIRESSSAGRD